MQKSRALYPHPFSGAYWRDAAAELKDVRMLVIAALLTALRIAMKPLAIPLAPQLSIQTAMLATALGAMIFGPVIAIPAAIISDTIGFVLFPTGDYFLPFVLTEIASTMIYALCLYRCKVTPTRVMLARFLICLLVNIVLQQLVFAWWYVYIGSPDKAKSQILGIMGIARFLKNMAFFPIESVVLTLFLRALMPVTNRMGLTYTGADAKKAMTFTVKQIVTLVILLVVGCGCGLGYMNYYYNTTSLSASYSAEERTQRNTDMVEIVAAEDSRLNADTTVTTIESAYKKFMGKEVTYTVAVYTVDGEALQGYDMDLAAIRGLSKSKAKKVAADGIMEQVATATVIINEETGEVLSCQMK